MTRNANPFYRDTIKIIESRPHLSVIPEKVLGISIDYDKANYKAKADLATINRILEQIPQKDDIKLFEITYNSKLKDLPRIDLFPNILYAHIAGREIKNYDRLYKLKKIHSLFLVNYKCTKLSNFADLKLEEFRAIRGRIEQFDISTKNAFLQSCNKLVEFRKVEIERLCMDGGQHVDLNTLTNISNLYELQLLGIKHIPSFNFIEKCATLRHLVVTANPLTKSDLSALMVNKNLYSVFLSVRNSMIKELGSINLDVIFSNGEVCYHKGKAVQHKDAYPHNT